MAQLGVPQRKNVDERTGKKQKLILFEVVWNDGRSTQNVCAFVGEVRLAVVSCEAGHLLPAFMSNSVGTWPHPFVCVCCLCCSCTTVAELSSCIWSAEPKIFTVWLFTEKVCQCLFQSHSLLQLSYKFWRKNFSGVYQQVAEHMERTLALESDKPNSSHFPFGSVSKCLNLSGPKLPHLCVKC